MTRGQPLTSIVDLEKDTTPSLRGAEPVYQDIVCISTRGASEGSGDAYLSLRKGGLTKSYTNQM